MLSRLPHADLSSCDPWCELGSECLQHTSMTHLRSVLCGASCLGVVLCMGAWLDMSARHDMCHLHRAPA